MKYIHTQRLNLFVTPLLLLLTIVFSFISNAQTGALDPTFGTNGKVITSFTPYGSTGNSMALQSDGKIILGGYSFSYYAISDFSLARYNTDGSLDTTFGSNGLVITDIELRSKGTAIGIQTDGKIVLGGNSSHSINLARYDTNGSLDTTFGTGGTVISGVPGFYGNRCTSLLIQDDGKILISGNNSHMVSDIFHCFLARYTPTGDLDSTFGVTGIVYGSTEKINSVDIQNDGKIVAAGSDYTDLNLFRYHANGIIDSTFGVNGKVITPITNVSSEGKKIKVLNSGKILLGGVTFNSNATSDFALAQYNSNGTLDNSFGTGGIVITNISSGISLVNDMEIQTDGKIVLAGYTQGDSVFTSNFAAARYTSNGQLDNSFGQGGTVITELYSSYNQANSTKIQTDGKIILAGFAIPDSISDFALIRYNENAVGSIEIELNDNTEVNSFSLYPNPLSSASKIQSEISLKNAELVVYNYQGEIVKFIPNISGSSVPFFPQELSSGLYFLNISQEGTQIGSCKFIINNK